MVVADRAKPKSVVAMLILLASTIAAAQDEDLTLPPRLDGTPFAARLAATPAERDEALEEVVVVGENEWRLPDLGSAWRQRQEDAEVPARIEASFLPLYDPEVEPEQRNDFLAMSSELHRVGFIEIFQIRFGRRSQD